MKMSGRLSFKNMVSKENKLKEVGGEKVCPITVIMRDNKLLFGCRHYSSEQIVWTNVGGRSEIGETIEQALRREVVEEVGINDLEIVDFIAEVAGAKEEDIVPIFFSTTNQDARLMEPEKFSEWRWITIDEYFNGKDYVSFNPRAREVIENYLKNLHEEI
jgi:ADP-ribose pyrophosphatase YjhB (NUDIX family)